MLDGHDETDVTYNLEERRCQRRVTRTRRDQSMKIASEKSTEQRQLMPLEALEAQLGRLQSLKLLSTT